MVVVPFGNIDVSAEPIGKRVSGFEPDRSVVIGDGPVGITLPAICRSPARHPVVSEAMRGWRNRAPAPRQADALTSDALARIRELLRLPRRGRRGRVESVETAHRRAALDLAIIGVLADGGLRGRGPEWQSSRPPPALWVKSGPLTPTQELRYSG